MSLLLKVVAELVDPAMASFELGPCDLAESFQSRQSGMFSSKEKLGSCSAAPGPGSQTDTLVATMAETIDSAIIAGRESRHGAVISSCGSFSP